MLERNNLQSDTNLYGENDLFLIDDKVHSIYSSINYWKKYSKNKYDKLDSYDDLDNLLGLLNNPDDDYFIKHIGLILDLDNFYRWQINSILINSLHQNNIHNARLYFDIEIGKFKFIPWDVSPSLDNRYGLETKIIDFNYNELVTRILKNDEFRQQRDLILWSYVKDENNLKEDLEYYDKLFTKTRQSFYKDWKKPESNLKMGRQIQSGRNIIEESFLNIRNNLENSFVNANIRIANIDQQNFLNLEITIDGHSSINWQSIELIGISNDWIGLQIYQDTNNNGRIDMGDKRLSIKYQKEIESIKIENINEILFSNHNWDKDYLETIDILPNVYNYLLYFPNKLFVDEEKFNVKLGFKNIVTEKKIEPLIKYSYKDKFIEIDSDINRYDFIKNYSLFSIGTEDNEIKIKRGTYFINKNIIIPSQFKLKINSGVQLNFSPDVSLISYGSIDAQGTNQEPIIFTGQNKSDGWGVLAMVDSGKNIFENCIIEYGGEAYINGIFLVDN